MPYTPFLLITFRTQFFHAKLIFSYLPGNLLPNLLLPLLLRLFSDYHSARLHFPSAPALWLALLCTHIVGKVAQVLDILRLVIVLDLLVRYDALVIDLPDQPIAGAWHHALDQLASAAPTIRSCGSRCQGAKCLLQLRQLRLIDGARLQRRQINQLRIPIQLIRQRQVTFLWEVRE